MINRKQVKLKMHAKMTRIWTLTTLMMIMKRYRKQLYMFLKVQDALLTFCSCASKTFLKRIVKWSHLKSIVFTILSSYFYFRQVLQLIRKFKHSAKAIQNLKLRTGKTLLTPIITRWSSLLKTYARILEVFDDFAEVCLIHNWDPLTEENRKTMHLIFDVLKPFQELTTRLQCEKHPTISLVYPGIIGLISALKVNSFIRLVFLIFLG